MQIDQSHDMGLDQIRYFDSRSKSTEDLRTTNVVLAIFSALKKLLFSLCISSIVAHDETVRN